MLGEPLRANGQSPMRRHTLLKGLEVEIEILGPEAISFHVLQELMVVMNSLPTGSDFLAFVEEVKTSG